MPGRLVSLLRLLVDAQVDFVLVGGLSGVINGAPIHTIDMGIVHSREPENIARLLALLVNLKALYRAQPERQLRPTASHLAGEGHHNLMTRLGWLDLLGTVGIARRFGYADLLAHAHPVRVAAGVEIQVLDLEMYITLKAELGGDKDRAMLPVLRQTLAERRKSGVAF